MKALSVEPKRQNDPKRFEVNLKISSNWIVTFSQTSLVPT
ncbi:hypothetical protein Javan330_0011 [Streptococcus phage Javan330]|nr:hypothetical protein Javan330_0011 [Streptococcus phage Javan330]